MVTVSDQVVFAAQLIAMVVAVSGLVLVCWRGELVAEPVARAALAIGFVILATVAFLVGANLGASDALAAARIAGGVIAFAGAWRWSGGRFGRLALLGGSALAAGAGAVTLAGPAPVWAAVLLVAGALLAAVGLVATGQRAIGVRVAVNAATTLLLVVVVLGVALSSVLALSLQRRQLADQRSLAAVQAADVARLATTNLATARLVAGEIETYFGVPGQPALADVIAGANAGRYHEQLLVPLRRLATFATNVTLGLVTPHTVVTTDAGGFGPAARAGHGPLGCMAGTPGSTGSQTMVEEPQGVYALGWFPLCGGQPLKVVAAVGGVTPVDERYLAKIRFSATGSGVAVVNRHGTVLVRSGPDLTADELRDARRSVPNSRVVGTRFVTTVPIGITDAGWIVSTTPTSPLLSTLHSVLRTLLLIALGGTLLCLVLAAATGSRIAAGLRRITRAAEDVGEQGTAGRSLALAVGTSAPDEVGALATAFDSMVGAVEDSNVALRQSADDATRLRNRLEAVIGGMGDALVALDGLITDFNRAAQALTGVAAASAVGRPGAELLVLSGDGAVGLRQHLERGDSSPWSGIADLRRSDGTVVPVAVSSGAVWGPFGEEVGTVLVFRDLRREEEIERMKTQFLSRVGHELRTPLTGIIGYAELLAGRDIPAEVAGPWYDEILAAARQQLRVVRLLELFASWGAGRTVLRPEVIDPGTLVEGVARNWRERLESGDDPAIRRLSVAVDPQLPRIFADPAWLALAVDEVIDNAVKYAPNGGVLTVAVRAVDDASPALAHADEIVAEGPARSSPAGDAGPAVEIAVTDQGVGLVGEEINRVFGAFEQGDASDTRRFGGLGLGLAAVVHIVGSHGGWVGCRSTLGLGTTVRLVLPAASEPEIPAETAPTRDSSAGG